ncbi:NDR1/HIN1-like protein 6 [Lotus japonicus]|uniref:Late embryogenesis abundant protein LEA-2 subgroup domain-containing protein n=1 Tax=Lotus japonicus TaxID=34305 RepID=I3S471_LOTJA|nr:NDR1/HIN1-like protein 6 [Lotus japonicus]AFK35063.1 unknown [Lotus japonicus]
MADHQRIHPAHDVESPNTPTAPLVPENTAKSDSGDPTTPLPQRTHPVMYSNPPKKRRSCCCRFFCCIFSTLLILIIAIAITVGVLYLVFNPKLPKYSVDKLRVTQFNYSESNSLSVTFNVAITARNPNKKIGIYYVGGSHISAWYEDTKLCEGSLPKFYQGHKNTTVLDLPLTGETQDASGLQSSLQQQLQQVGNIPLHLRVNQPVRIKLGKLKLFKIKFRVRCKLVVDSLGANDDVRISNSSCKFRLRL